MSDKLVIAVISDLHCRTSSSDTSGTTRLHSDQARKPELRHPVSAIKKLIVDKGLKADVILCPGDITDKADDQGFLSGWDYLKDIRNAFGAKHLLATLGNHDVKSRGIVSEPFHFAKNLDNDYPLGSDKANSDFWSDSFSLINDDDTLYLIFNSSYSHINADNANKCVITDAILELMRVKLASLDTNKKFKVAMCHHHPINHYNMDYIDSDFIDKGDVFVRMLKEYGFQLLLHGHKHDPRLTMYNGLPILAAGSFSSLANLNEVGAENVFHIIYLESNCRKGTINTFVYKPQKGWVEVKDAHFPFKTGFGAVSSIDSIGLDCQKWFSGLKQDVGHYSDLLMAVPELQYLVPDDQQALHNKLIETYQLEFVPELFNNPTRITRQVS